MRPEVLKQAPSPARRAPGLVQAVLVALVVGAGVGFGIGWGANGAVHDSENASPSTTSSSSKAPPVAAAVSSSMARPEFVLLGDSLTQWGSNVTTGGWVSLLAADYAHSADVINRGNSGGNTRGFIRDWLPSLRKELSGWLQPSLITLWLGANDATDSTGRHGRLYVPVDEYQENMVAILKALAEAAPQAKILLLTPPTVDADMRRDDQERAGAAREPPDRTNEVLGEYAAAARAAGKAVAGVATLDVYDYFMTTHPNATERRALQLDGLHLSRLGNADVFSLVNEQIKHLLPAFAGRVGSDYIP